MIERVSDSSLSSTGQTIKRPRRMQVALVPRCVTICERTKDCSEILTTIFLRETCSLETLKTSKNPYWDIFSPNLHPFTVPCPFPVFTSAVNETSRIYNGKDHGHVIVNCRSLDQERKDFSESQNAMHGKFRFPATSSDSLPIRRASRRLLEGNLLKLTCESLPMSLAIQVVQLPWGNHRTWLFQLHCSPLNWKLLFLSPALVWDRTFFSCIVFLFRKQ